MHLRMRAGDFNGYLRNVHALRSQLNPALAEPALTFAFTRGLPPEFEQEVLYSRAADLPQAIERALLFDSTRRTGAQSSSGSFMFSENARHVSFQSSPSRSEHSSHSSSSPHSISPFRRNSADTQYFPRLISGPSRTLFPDRMPVAYKSGQTTVRSDALQSSGPPSRPSSGRSVSQCGSTFFLRWGPRMVLLG